jgi:hypothetical protein
LKVNKLPAGNNGLPNDADSLKQIQFEAAKPAARGSSPAGARSRNRAGAFVLAGPTLMPALGRSSLASGPGTRVASVNALVIRPRGAAHQNRMSDDRGFRTARETPLTGGPSDR